MGGVQRVDLPAFGEELAQPSLGEPAAVRGACTWHISEAQYRDLTAHPAYPAQYLEVAHLRLGCQAMQQAAIEHGVEVPVISVQLGGVSRAEIDIQAALGGFAPGEFDRARREIHTGNRMSMCG